MSPTAAWSLKRFRDIKRFNSRKTCLYWQKQWTSCHKRQLSGLLFTWPSDWLSPRGVMVFCACLDTGHDPRLFTQQNVFTQVFTNRVDHGNRKQQNWLKRCFESSNVWTWKRSMPTFYTRAFSSSGKKVSENIFPPFQLLRDQTIAVAKSRCTFVWAGRFSSCPSSVLVNLHTQPVFQSILKHPLNKWSFNIW